MPKKEDVVAIIRAYNVRSHYEASRKGLRYAVFGPTGQVTEPTKHAEAAEMCRQIIAQDILDLFDGEN